MNNSNSVLSQDELVLINILNTMYNDNYNNYKNPILE